MNEVMLGAMVAGQNVTWRAVNRIRKSLVSFHRNEAGDIVQWAIVAGLAVVLGLVILKKFWGNWEDGTGIAGVFKSLSDQLTGTFGGKTSQ